MGDSGHTSLLRLRGTKRCYSVAPNYSSPGFIHLDPPLLAIIRVNTELLGNKSLGAVAEYRVLIGHTHFSQIQGLPAFEYIVGRRHVNNP
jgi:hypothetical protein